MDLINENEVVGVLESVWIDLKKIVFMLKVKIYIEMTFKLKNKKYEWPTFVFQLVLSHFLSCQTLFNLFKSFLT